MVHNIYYTYKFIQTLQWVPIFAADYMIATKKVDLIYSRSNFCHENIWDEKRLVSSYSSVPMIAKAYHLECEYNDAPKFGSSLYCSAVEPKICKTMYCRPFNVGTFRFCWCILYQQYMSFWIDLQCFNFKLQASSFKSSSFLASPRFMLYKQTALCLQITSSGWRHKPLSGTNKPTQLV